MSLGQIAWLLGYEGPTSFNHAFKRGLDGRLPLIGARERAGRLSLWREKIEFWQALTTRAQQQPLSCFPTADEV